MIQVLPGLEAVRKRPAMYVGDVNDGSGFHHLLDEVVNNALGEASAGHCKEIQIELNADGSATVRDDGRGIPTQSWREEPIPLVIMTQLHCGGKFDQDAGDRPAELRGVGIAVVNALSEKLDLRIWREGKEHVICFRRGIVDVPFSLVGNTTRRGTEIIFLPDTTIFPSLRFDFERVQQRIRSLAHLDLGVAILLSDNRHGASTTVTLEV